MLAGSDLRRSHCLFCTPMNKPSGKCSMAGGHSRSAAGSALGRLKFGWQWSNGSCWLQVSTRGVGASRWSTSSSPNGERFIETPGRLFVVIRTRWGFSTPTFAIRPMAGLLAASSCSTITRLLFSINGILNDTFWRRSMVDEFARSPGSSSRRFSIAPTTRLTPLLCGRPKDGQLLSGTARY